MKIGKIPMTALVIGPWLIAHALYYFTRDVHGEGYSLSAQFVHLVSKSSLLFGVGGGFAYWCHKKLVDFDWRPSWFFYTLSVVANVISTFISIFIMLFAMKSGRVEFSNMTVNLTFFGGVIASLYFYVQHCEYVGACFCRAVDEFRAFRRKV